MCLLQSLIISERFCITLHAILKVVCPIKVNDFFVVKVLINTCIFPKISVPSEGTYRIIQLLSQTALALSIYNVSI